METTQPEAARELHNRVRECFTRHNFKTFGKALQWWHNTDHDILTSEAGECGLAQFSNDILWLISMFGPTAMVEKPIYAQKAPTLSVSETVTTKIAPDKITRPKKTKSKRRRF